MDKLKLKPTLVLGNSNNYAAVLVDLQEIKETQIAVNKVNTQLKQKYDELIENILKIKQAWEEAGKDTSKLDDLLNRQSDPNDPTKKPGVNENHDQLIVRIEEIQNLIDSIQENIDAFASNISNDSSSSKQYDSYLNMFIKELKDIVKDDTNNE